MQNFHLACEIDQNVCFPDHLNHCVYQIDILDQSLSLYLAQGGTAGQNDGPKQNTRLCYAVRLAAKGHLAAEHPLESQGTIRMACSLEGFTRFQSVWQ